MQRIKTSAFALLAIVLSFTAYSQPKVTAYTNDFSGMSAEFAIGKYDNIALLQLGIAVVRSVKVPAGMQVILFEKDNFEGNSLVLLQDANLKLLEGKGFGQIIQRVSLIVEKAPESVLNQPTITIYKDNFSGASLALRPGYYDHFELGNVGNDNLSSVKIPKGVKVTLYEHGGYQGRSLVITQDAAAPFLIQNNFNDLTSSIFVELIPEPVKEPQVVVKEEPVKIIIPIIIREKEPIRKKEPVVSKDNGEVISSEVILFEGNYSGVSKKLGPGRYTGSTLSIRDNSLTSLKVPEGFIVTLFDQPNFKGRSFIIKGDETTAVYLESFDNVVSSFIIELTPRVTVYADNANETGYTLAPGYYDVNEFGVSNDELSAIKVPTGMWVLVFEHSGFTGRSLLLTQDANLDFLSGKEFNNVTSSLILGDASTPQPIITLFDGDAKIPLKKLTTGQYPALEVGNEMISSVDIPRGLKVTLYEESNFEGRSMVITQRVDLQFMKENNFDNITSSLIVEQRNPRDLFVTVYSGSYTGFRQDLIPGKYFSRDIKIGERDLSSLRIPGGMQVQLFVNGDLTGLTTSLDRDTDFSGNRMDNQYSSLIVSEIHKPIVTPLELVKTEAVEEVVYKSYEEPTVFREPGQGEVVEEIVSCQLDNTQYQDALKSIQSKPFKDEKMEMVMLVTKDKCLTNDQIRGIAKQFGYEDQALTFVKHAYDKALDKGNYYQLENIFTFYSSKTAFNKFLKEKQ